MKRRLIALCDFFKYQLENDKCTAEEIKSVCKMAESNLEVDATVKDMADFFGQSEQNVNNVIHRHYGDKPKRRVYHNLNWVLTQAPSKWLSL